MPAYCPARSCISFFSADDRGRVGGCCSPLGATSLGLLAADFAEVPVGVVGLVVIGCSPAGFMFFSWLCGPFGITGDIVGVVVSAVLFVFVGSVGEFGVAVASKFGNFCSECSEFIVAMVQSLFGCREMLLFVYGFFWCLGWWDIGVLSIGRHSGCLLWIGPVFHAKGRYPFTG